MSTKKDIFGRGLSYNVGKEDKPKYDLPKGDAVPSLDYGNPLNKLKTGELSFDSYLDAILARKQKPQSEDTSRIDKFLKKRTGMNYENFVDYARPEEIKENSYGLFNRASIRRSLFKSKSRIYLEALCDFEEMGGDIQAVLDDIRIKHVPTLKKDKGKEPTFEAIYSVLKKT